MYKLLSFCLLFINLSLNTATLISQTKKYTYSDFNTPQKKSEFLLRLAKSYSTNAYSILNRKPYEYFIRWAKGKGHFEVLSSYATVVHETCHLVNDDIGGFWSKGFYISPNIEIRVSKSTVFKSSILDNQIPEDWKTNIFRYKTYIQGFAGEKEIASISEGIYGLMDEFDAYYQSTRAVVEIYDYYKTIASYSEPYYWTLYISNCYSSIYAYHEFRLFIAWYLKYARKNYPDIYLSIMQNKELRAVFTLVDAGYKKVVDQYFDNRKTIIEKINKTGKKKAKISEKYFIIETKNGTSMGYGIPDSEIKFLDAILTIEDYQLLKLFEINGLNEGNYKVFKE